MQDRTEFVSFFEIVYAVNSTADIDLDMAGEVLTITYNNLLKPTFSNDEDGGGLSYDDPFERRMERVEVVESTYERKLGEEETRNLQFNQVRNLNVVVRVTGSCTGCPSRSRFTNQVQRRHLSRRRAQGKGGDKTSPDEGTVPPEQGSVAPIPPISGGTPPPTLPPIPPESGGTSPPVVSTPAPIIAETVAPVSPTSAPVIADTVPPVSPTSAPVIAGTVPPVVAPTFTPVNGDTPPPVVAPTTAPVTPGTMGPTSDLPMLPLTETLRLAYTLEIRRWEIGIYDVPFMEEIDGPEMRSVGSARSGLTSARAAYCARSLHGIYHCP